MTQKTNSQNLQSFKTHLEDEIVQLCNIISELRAERSRIDMARTRLEAHIEHYEAQLKKVQAA